MTDGSVAHLLHDLNSCKEDTTSKWYFLGASVCEGGKIGQYNSMIQKVIWSLQRILFGVTRYERRDRWEKPKSDLENIASKDPMVKDLSCWISNYNN